MLPEPMKKSGRSIPIREHRKPTTRPAWTEGRFPILGLLGCLVLGLCLASCALNSGANSDPTATPPLSMATVMAQSAATRAEATPDVPQVALSLKESDVQIEPLPLRAGTPFSVTATIHNHSGLNAEAVPVYLFISAVQEEIGFSPFVQVLTVTVPATQSMGVILPVHWNLQGGEHELWLQVNKVPDAWQSRLPAQPEADLSDNGVLLNLLIDPFDAYTSELCSGRTDVEIRPEDVLPEPDNQRVMVRVRNVGNQAVYNVPVVVLGNQLSGIAYTPVIPPCGGTVALYVEVDRPFSPGQSLTVMVNPADWEGSLAEDDWGNNQVTVDAGLAPGMVVPAGSGLDDYDFRITSADIETPETGMVMVTVHNQGTRDAAMVPIRIENAAGRKINDVIPLVQGNGQGVVAISVGYLWTQGGTLTFTVNPEDAKEGYPETHRDNNVATFTLP